MKRTTYPVPLSPKRRKKTGPKSKCTPEVVDQAYRLCILGFTDWQLADYLGVDPQMIAYWKNTQEAFRQAVERGGIEADQKVADALYHSALGYSHDSIKFFKDTVTEREYNDEGVVVKERSYGRIIKQPYVKQYPPNVKAILKWLSVRRRADWGETFRVEHEHRHQMLLAGNINIHTVLEELGDKVSFTDQELAVVARLGLNRLVADGEGNDI